MGPLSKTDPGFRSFLEKLGNETGQYRMAARNFLLDQGIVDARRDSYQNSGAMMAHKDRKSWKGQHKKYLEQRVYRIGPSTGIPRDIEQSDEDLCPETFRFIPSDSPFLSSDARLHLVRIEELSFISRLSGQPMDRIRDLARDVAENGTAATGFPALDSVLRTWARNVQLRPVFSAFWEDLSDLFGARPEDDPGDWPDRLRDRLGLAHYDPVARRNGPIDILVFRYQVGALARIHELGADLRALVPPTVLDGDFSDAFCPAPSGATTGQTLDLGGEAKQSCREVLHPSLAFTAEHLWRVGAISSPVDLASLDTLRGLHLLWLRAQTGIADYAAETDGDLL